MATPHLHAGGGPPQLSRLTPNVIGTAQYAAPEIMNEDLMEVLPARTLPLST